MQYQERLDEAEARYNELTAQMADPAVINDAEQYRKIAKAQSEAERAGCQISRVEEGASRELHEARAMLAESDPDLRQMAEAEVRRLEPEVARNRAGLRNSACCPRIRTTRKTWCWRSARARAATRPRLFAGEVFRMYTRYAEEQGWKVEITSFSESSVGGLNEVIALISGKKVYSRLKYESGVHRVQRVPATETQGRVHTSTITVAVMPEADEVEVQIDAKDSPHRHFLFLGSRAASR